MKRICSQNHPGFCLYRELFDRLKGSYETVRPTKRERRLLVKRLADLTGEPKDLVEGAREDILATATVKEVRDYAGGMRYVRYEVSAMVDDCSWDGPYQLLTVWDRGGKLLAYTFIHGTGRAERVAADMHIEHEGVLDDRLTESQDEALAFLRLMKTGDCLLVGNDACNGEWVTISRFKAGLVVGWQVFADAWEFSAKQPVSLKCAADVVREFWKSGIVGVQELLDWEPTDPWDEISGKRPLHIARELRRAFLQANRTGDRSLKATLKDSGVRLSGVTEALDVSVPHGKWSEMIAAVDRFWSESVGTWSERDRDLLDLYLAIQNRPGACLDIATRYAEETDEGTPNPKADFKKKIYWLERGARTGDVRCQAVAGLAYRCEEDDGSLAYCKKAQHWLKKAVAQKEPDAMKGYADCLECEHCPDADKARSVMMKAEAKRLKKAKGKK